MDGITGNDGFIVVNSVDGIVKQEWVLAWVERIIPQSDASKTLAKGHVSWKNIGMAEAHIHVLLVIVPDCPQ